MNNKIPIQNLWFLVLYSSEYVHNNMTGLFKVDSSSGLEQLLAKVFLTNIKDYISQHLRKQSRAKENEIAVVKGKINFYQTAVRQSLSKGLIYCSYREATYNTSRHSYMLSALNIILSFNISKNVRMQLNSIKFELKNYGVVDELSYEISKDHFSSFEHICRKVVELSKLIHDMKTLSTEFGDTIQPKLILSDHKIRKIFEKGIAGFFKINLPKEYQIKSSKGSQIDLMLTHDLVSKEYFPRMYLDMLILKGKSGLIIDTKFASIFQKNYENKNKISSDYIRQIYTYVMSYKLTNPDKNYAGMLLYPAIDGGYKMSVNMLSIPLFFYTIDLSKKIPEIHSDLLGIIDEIFELI
ncbi:hypothetical protein [uncultured Acinetobacter sp.]|uniref:5-methylcytosine restriction system specificity protein McrC n=1 Tax=uncultured Acinetobacter sp. TaxID=165433 RepID=UPI00258330E6|nr:hypothetical protein [uncultured Acinetobacter sp.]